MGSLPIQEQKNAQIPFIGPRLGAREPPESSIPEIRPSEKARGLAYAHNKIAKARLILGSWATISDSLEGLLLQYGLQHAAQATTITARVAKS